MSENAAPAYEKMYRDRMGAVTSDWRQRRLAIELPEDQRIGRLKHPTQSQFAEMAGRSCAAYARCERNEATPSLDTFTSVMQVFDRFGV